MGEKITLTGTEEGTKEWIRQLEASKALIVIADEIVRAVLMGDGTKADELCFDYISVRREHGG